MGGSGRRWLHLVSSAAAALLAAGSLARGLIDAWPFTIDDAGIVYAYAEHLAAGQGFRAVSGGPIVEGYSDFSWVMILAVAAKAGFAPPAAAKVLGALLLVWTAVAAGALVRLSEPRSAWSCALPAVVMGTCPEFVVWAPSGLENSLFAASLVTALFLDARESRAPALTPFSGLAALAISLTRPEGVLYAGVLGAFKLWCARKDSRYRRQSALFFGLLLVPFAAYHAFHWVTFRSFVPNTFYAKSPGLDGLGTGVDYMLTGLITTGMIFLIPLAVAGLWAGPRTNAPALAFAAVSLAFAVYSRGDWMPHFRFVGIALPMLAALATTGLVILARLMARLAPRSPIPEVALGGVLIAAGAGWAAHQSARFEDVRSLKWCQFCSRLTDAIVHRAERDVLGLGAATFLTHDFGGPAYSSTPGFMPLDLLGLADQSAALVEYERTKGDPRADFSRAQYFFHEQPDYPTFLYFTDNFWKALPQMPEFQFGYRQIRLTAPTAGKLVPPTRLHLGAFVDYFPRGAAFRFEPIGEDLRLVTAAAWRGREPSEVSAEVSVQPVSSAPITLRLRVAGSESEARRLFGGNGSVGRGIAGAGPVSVALSITVPAGTRPEEVIELGVGAGDGDTTFTALMPLSRALGAPPASPRLPFPNNLPGTSYSELMQLGRRLRVLIDCRRAGRDYTLRDEGLGDALVAAARRAQNSNRKSDVYLGYVWAIQADPDLTRTLHREVFDLRLEADQNAYLLEEVLLQKFYATGDAYWQLQLVASYLAAKKWDQAAYFLERLPAFADPAWLREAAELRARVDARAAEGAPSPFAWARLPGIASDFEQASIQGWSLERGGFRSRSNGGQDTKPVWGIAGAGYLSSEGVGGPSTASSVPFTIEGTALSFVIAGGDRGVLRAELVIGDTTVEAARTPGSRSFTPILWDTTRLRGRVARLRLVDESDGVLQFLAVDDFRVWPFVEATRKAR